MSRLEAVRDTLSRSPTAIATLLVGVAMFSSGLLAAFVSRTPIVVVAYYASAAMVVALCLARVIVRAKERTADRSSTRDGPEEGSHGR